MSRVNDFNLHRRSLWFGLLLTLATAPVVALESDKEQPIAVEADSVEIDEGKQVSTYLGSVVIVQGSMRLEADRVLVHYWKSKPQRVEAFGKPVHFQQLPEPGKALVKGEGDKLDYFVTSEEVVLSDHAVLRQDKDSFASDRIVYDRVKGKLKAGAAAKGKERVRIQIQPATAAGANPEPVK
jgi:lipopolysaccharide export system protein LptA